MALPTVEEVAKYLRAEEILEDEEEKAFLSSLILVAKEDLADSGVKNTETERYGMAIKLMVSNLYEERLPQIIGRQVSKTQFSLERIILQLKAAELPGSDSQ